MKKNSIFALVLGLSLLGTSAQAQLFKNKSTEKETTEEKATEETATEEKAATKKSKTDPKKATKEEIKADHFLGYDGKGAVAINVSSIGLGVEYAHNFHRHFNGRVRLNFLTLSDLSQELEFNGINTLVTANADVFNVDFLVEYLPFPQSNFKIVGGLSYVSAGKGDINIAFVDEIAYGDISIAPEDVGDMTIGIDYSGVAPYFGIGFGRAVPRKAVGFAVELGTLYVGSPDVSLTATNMLSETSVEQGQLQENFNDYKWMPFINMRLSFRL